MAGHLVAQAQVGMAHEFPERPRRKTPVSDYDYYFLAAGCFIASLVIYVLWDTFREQ
jgi:hypothetical protein